MDFLRAYQLEITLGVALLAVFELLVILSVRARMAHLGRMLRTLLSGPGGADLEKMLHECREQSEHAMMRTNQQEELLNQLAEVSRASLQHFALVRYDAFEDVSGQQSFSLVLLDADQNGAVVTSLFTRSDNRCYGKPIAAGVPQQELSSEEQHALEVALAARKSTFAQDEKQDSTKPNSKPDQGGEN